MGLGSEEGYVYVAQAKDQWMFSWDNTSLVVWLVQGEALCMCVCALIPNDQTYDPREGKRRKEKCGEKEGGIGSENERKGGREEEKGRQGEKVG